MSLKNVSALNYKKIIIFIAGIIIMFFLWKLICRIVDKNAFNECPAEIIWRD